MTPPVDARVPFVGQTVHYQSYGTPGGEYLPEPRAAIITEVHSDGPEDPWATASLAVLNPTGLFFTTVPFAETPTPGHWNYMPRTEAGGIVQAVIDDVVRIANWDSGTEGP